ncbi:Dirigent protein [Quillaja saponaria]|uniref:Dirigent protein n=1 Tax=Quillaja saponaria TaxID=32244 RepID=A0AAD7QBV4_QUISA|nr:Dirigent protein [Quillaja saponaria]
MESKLTLILALILCSATIPVQSNYYSESKPVTELKEQVTNLEFYLFDVLTGKNPTALLVAKPNNTIPSKYESNPFGSLYAVDDPLRTGPETNSEIIGNAKGLYVSSSLDDSQFTIVLYMDFAFTTGKFNGSSLSVLSRNPVTEPTREVAVVGGRGKFRFAKGFAEVKTHFINVTTGDAILNYKVTVFHY